jgi:hypothetical protein
MDDDDDDDDDMAIQEEMRLLQVLQVDQTLVVPLVSLRNMLIQAELLLYIQLRKEMQEELVLPRVMAAVSSK